jgi:hypothetical protein
MGFCFLLSFTIAPTGATIAWSDSDRQPCGAGQKKKKKAHPFECDWKIKGLTK